MEHLPIPLPTFLKLFLNLPLLLLPKLGQHRRRNKEDQYHRPKPSTTANNNKKNPFHEQRTNRPFPGLQKKRNTNEQPTWNRRWDEWPWPRSRRGRRRGPKTSSCRLGRRWQRRPRTRPPTAPPKTPSLLIKDGRWRDSADPATWSKTSLARSRGRRRWAVYSSLMLWPDSKFGWG